MFNFCVSSHVFHDGRDECGDPIERLSYYVVATAPNGRRYAHEKTFINCEEAATHLLGRIEAAYGKGHEPDWETNWYEIDPVYGSESYISQGIEEQRWMEDRKEAGLFY